MTFNLKILAKIVLAASVFAISNSVYAEGKTCAKHIEYLKDLKLGEGSYVYVVQCTD